MAGGPIFAYSAVPVNADKVFPNVHIGAGSGCKYREGLGVMASLSGDAVWALMFQLPMALPSGTGKLRLIVQANATSGVAKVNAKWGRVAMGADPSSVTLNAEGTTTVTWSSGDADDLKEVKIDLDAATLTAGEEIAMNLTFETSGWTLAQISTWMPTIIWE